MNFLDLGKDVISEIINLCSYRSIRSLFFVFPENKTIKTKLSILHKERIAIEQSKSVIKRYEIGATDTFIIRSIINLGKLDKYIRPSKFYSKVIVPMLTDHIYDYFYYQSQEHIESAFILSVIDNLNKYDDQIGAKEFLVLSASDISFYGQLIRYLDLNDIDKVIQLIDNSDHKHLYEEIRIRLQKIVYRN